VNPIGLLADFRVFDSFKNIDYRDVRIIDDVLASICVQKTIQIQIKILEKIQKTKLI